MNRALLAIFGIILASLLVGQRFGFVWAGGEGYAPPLPAHSGETAYQRGETIRIGTEHQILKIGSQLVIGLEANTEIVLDQLYAEETIIRLNKGRLVIINGDQIQQLIIKTNFTESLLRSGSRASFVNYDFKETVSMIPIEGMIATSIASAGKFFLTPTPVEVHETNPVTITDITFNPETSASAAFYRWFEEQTVDAQ